MKRLFSLLLFAAPTFAQVQAVNVPIQNPSFEQLPVQDSHYQLPNAVMQTSRCYDYFMARYGYPNELPSSWFRKDQSAGSIEIQRPNGQCLTFPAAPDGSWILYLSSSTVYNELTTKPSDLQPPGVGQATGLYVMKFWVANYFTVYPGYYEASIIVGTIDPITHAVKGHELCSWDGWATQHFSEVTFPCLSPDYLLGYWPDENPEAADPNAHLIISLAHTKGWPLLFDNVSLTFTPTN